MRINQRGRVGILTTTAAYPLDVNGEIRSTSTILSHIGGANGYMMMSPGNSSVTGYNGFYLPNGNRGGYIGNVSSGAYIQLQSENGVLGYSVNGTLRTASEIQTTGSSVINFGYDQTKADGATGRIGYGTYEAIRLRKIQAKVTMQR